jgi:hypothetical protein
MRASAQRPLFHVVGFSGHRHILDSTAAAQAARAALEVLRHEGTGEWIALSSVAAGADILFAREALALDLAWHAMLICRGDLWLQSPRLSDRVQRHPNEAKPTSRVEGNGANILVGRG